MQAGIHNSMKTIRQGEEGTGTSQMFCVVAPRGSNKGVLPTLSKTRAKEKTPKK